MNAHLSAATMSGRDRPSLHGLLFRLSRCAESRRKGYVFASEAWMARQLGCSERTVQRELRALKSTGEIRIERPDRNRPNRIFVLAEPGRGSKNVGSERRLDRRVGAPKMSGRIRETVELNQETTATARTRCADVLQLERSEPEGIEQPLPIVADQLAKGLIESLGRHGVPPRAAGKLVAKHRPDVIERQLRALPYRHADDPPAMLVASIRDDYPEPKALRDERSRHDRQRERDDRDRERRAHNAAQEQRAVAAAERLAQLDVDERQRLRARAEADVDASVVSYVRSLEPAWMREKRVDARMRDAAATPTFAGASP